MQRGSAACRGERPCSREPQYTQAQHTRPAHTALTHAPIDSITPSTVPTSLMLASTLFVRRRSGDTISYARARVGGGASGVPCVSARADASPKAGVKR